MSRVLPALGAALFLAGPLAAQRPEDRSPAELRSLLARAQAQVQPFTTERIKREAESEPLRAGRLVQSGDVAIVVFAAVAPQDARAMAHAVDSLLTAFAVIPPAFVRSLVLVMPNTPDAQGVIDRSAAAGRRPVEMHVSGVKDVRPERRGSVLRPLLDAYVASLDESWRSWLAGGAENLGLEWTERHAAESGMEALTNAVYAVGEQCLVANAAGCRRYLGLDTEAEPYAARFTGAELRRHLGTVRGEADQDACYTGDDAACVAVAEGSNRLHQVPASSEARRSFLWSVRVRYGAAVLERALADSTGALADRLADAAGAPADSLVLGWRTWALSAGGQERVGAGLGDVAAAFGIISLLLVLATRRSQWH